MNQSSANIGFAGLAHLPGCEGQRAAAQVLRSGPLAAAARFTRDGSDGLECHLAEVCQKVSAGVRAIVAPVLLEGVLLAGGYGRGEGGVLRSEAGDLPYNDMEFYVFVRGSTLLNDRIFARKLHELGERLSPEAGLEVEFKILSLAKLRRGGISMFSYDLVSKHHWLIGDDSLLQGCEHHHLGQAIPLHEATRLLFNRCTGLLYSQERLQREEFTVEDADFVGRNLAKLRLALGDALLAAACEYHWSCAVRHERLQAWEAKALPFPKFVETRLLEGAEFRVILEEHRQGTAFKYHPHRSSDSREELSLRVGELKALASRIWLLVEWLRLNHAFSGPRSYAFSTLSKCPEHSRWRNLLVNARTFGCAAALSGKVVGYPRQRLLHALALLLWQDWTESKVLAVLQHELRSTASDLPGLIASYRQLWSRFN